MKKGMSDLTHEMKKALLRGLEEDAWQLDFTSLGTLSQAKKQTAQAKIVAKSEGIWVGESLAKAAELVSQEIAHPLKIVSKVKDGERLKTGQVVATLSGSTRGILTLERPFLNLASFMGGIAWKTAKLTDRLSTEWKKTGAKSPPPRVTPTRKTLPYFRDLSVYAVIQGGGSPHRVSLSGGVLIKENHIAAAGSILKAVQGCRKVAPHGLKIEVEVRNHKELKQAIEAKADIIMLDNFLPSQAKEAMKLLPGSERPLIEVSGGIDESTIADYAIPGVDIISVGGLTHSVKSIDLSLLLS